MYLRFIKRPLDAFLAAAGLAVLSPLFILIAIWIKLDSRGPVFFRQRRIGKGKSIFRIYKFRTMRSDAPQDVPTHLLNNPERLITASGRFLRKTSLDELPQLINILLGDMAVVGPRPALWNQDDLISQRDRHRGKGGRTPNDVRPGLTGWAQINGRDENSIQEKAALDGEYVRRMSFGFDVRCFVLTLVSVLRADGLREGTGGI